MKLPIHIKIGRRGGIVVGLVVVALAVLVPSYFVAANQGKIPSALHPQTLLKNPVAAITQTLAGTSPSPTPTTSPAATPAGQVAGTTTSATGGRANGSMPGVSATPSPVGSRTSSGNFGALVFSIPDIAVKISSYTKPFDISAADGTRLGPIFQMGGGSCGATFFQYNYPPALAHKQPTMVSGATDEKPRTCQIEARSTGENGRTYAGWLTVHLVPAPNFTFTADPPNVRPALTLMELRIKPEPGYAENYPEVMTDPDYPLPCSGDLLGGEAASWISSPGGDGNGNYVFTWHCHSEYILDPSQLPFPVHFIARSRHYTHKLTVMLTPQGTKFRNW